MHRTILGGQARRGLRGVGVTHRNGVRRGLRQRVRQQLHQHDEDHRPRREPHPDRLHPPASATSLNITLWWGLRGGGGGMYLHNLELLFKCIIFSAEFIILVQSSSSLVQSSSFLVKNPSCLV